MNRSSVDNILEWVSLGIDKEVKYLKSNLNMQLPIKLYTSVIDAIHKCRSMVLDMNISRPWKYKTIVN